jgi:hypothetical protein
MGRSRTGSTAVEPVTEAGKLKRLNSQAKWVQLGFALDWRAPSRRIVITSVTFNDRPVLSLGGETDPESPFPSPPPLLLGWAKRGTAANIGWDVRALDELAQIEAFVTEIGTGKWWQLGVATNVKPGGTFAGKKAYTP